MQNIEWKIKGLFKADATKCFEEITSLGDEVSPQEIVEHARDKDTELHKCFTWDNTAAAEKWRTHEARLVSSQLVIRHETADNEIVQIRVLTKTEDNRKYTSTKLMLKKDDGYATMLRQARAELSSFKRKYHTIEELSEIFSLIDW